MSRMLLLDSERSTAGYVDRLAAHHRLPSVHDPRFGTLVVGRSSAMVVVGPGLATEGHGRFWCRGERFVVLAAGSRRGLVPAPDPDAVGALVVCDHGADHRRIWHALGRLCPAGRPVIVDEPEGGRVGDALRLAGIATVPADPKHGGFVSALLREVLAGVREGEVLATRTDSFGELLRRRVRPEVAARRAGRLAVTGLPPVEAIIDEPLNIADILAGLVRLPPRGRVRRGPIARAVKEAVDALELVGVPGCRGVGLCPHGRPGDGFVVCSGRSVHPPGRDTVLRHDEVPRILAKVPGIRAPLLSCRIGGLTLVAWTRFERLEPPPCHEVECSVGLFEVLLGHLSDPRGPDPVLVFVAAQLALSTPHHEDAFGARWYVRTPTSTTPRGLANARGSLWIVRS